MLSHDINQCNKWVLYLYSQTFSCSPFPISCVIANLQYTSHFLIVYHCWSLCPSFSRPPKVIRARRSDEHLPPSKGVSRPSVGGAKRPSAPSSNVASRGGGGGGGRISDSRGRVGGGAPVGGSRNKSTPSSVTKKPPGKDKVHVCCCRESEGVRVHNAIDNLFCRATVMYYIDCVLLCMLVVVFWDSDRGLSSTYPFFK